MDFKSVPLGAPAGVPAPEDLFDQIVALPHAQFQQALAQLPPEMQATAVELHETMRAERSRTLTDLAKRLEQEKLAPIIRAKRSIEARWAEDDRQYHGFDRQAARIVDRQGISPGNNADAMPPGLNLTAARTNTWVARIVNMVCAGSILPGDVVPTPKPEMEGVEGIDPAQVDAMEQAAERAGQRMNRTIKDQFAECKLPRSLRKAAEDLCRYGVGIISGPQQVRPKRTKFRLVEGGGYSVYEAYTEKTVKPSWRRVNPRYFYPEMVEDIAEAGYCFELMLLTKREIADLAKQPGFEAFADQFAEILNPEYVAEIKGEIATNLTSWNAVSPAKEALDSRIAVWRFFGHVDLKDAEACGYKHDAPAAQVEGEPNQAPDLDALTPPLMEIWFSDGRILRADTMIPDGTTRLPYYVTPLFSIDETMFGGGIPYAGRDAQASINAIWRAAQHNASVSAAPQLGYMDGVAEPVDGDYRIRGPKLWRITEVGKRIEDALSQFEIKNNADLYLKLLEVRMQMFDEEINLPLISQGQPDDATPTASGLTMQMRAASVAILNVGQNCEDGWITPIFESAYHFNMLHNEDPSIKGDFDCVSRLVSDNVMREIKAQHLLMLAQMKKEDPDLALRVNPDVFYPRLAVALEQDADLFLEGEALAAAIQRQQEAQPQDPKVLEIQLKTQMFQAEDAFRQLKLERDHEREMQELQIRERETESRNFVAEKQLEIKLAELAQSVQTTVEQMRSQLGIEAEREATKRTKIQTDAVLKEQDQGVKARLEVEKLAQRDAENQIELQVEKTPRLA